VTGAALIVQGDALRLPIPDGSVDLIVTSPPYWALRAYQAGPGEIGSEPTPAAYLEALWAATAEMMRVLKPTGSAFIDLGDKYSTSLHSYNYRDPGTYTRKTPQPDGEWSKTGWLGNPNLQPNAQDPGIPPKSLMLLPERYRVGCVDRLGLIARAVIVWNKPNGLPESVTDRVRRSHEDWVHLVRSPRYYSATDEIREPHTMRPQRRPNGRPEDVTPRPGQPRQAWSTAQRDEVGIDGHPLGKLPGSVWSIPSEPLRLPEHLGVQHYAAFPSEWPRRLINGWSPPGICLECGQGRVPVVEREQVKSPVHGAGSIMGNRDGGPDERGWDGLPRFNMAATILGYACSCTPFTDHPERRGSDFHAGTDRAAQGMNDGNGGERFRRYQEQLANPRGPVREYHLDGWKPPPTRPAVVCDPFGGTGTVAMVARALGRIGISVDLSFPYGRAARWRVRHDGGKAISRTNLERQGQLPLTTTNLYRDWLERHDGINALGGHA
jgi:DNA modification methylase